MGTTITDLRRIAMQSVVVWTCNCGSEVKAMYDIDGTTTIRCPDVSCRTTHIVEGKVSKLWVRDFHKLWRPREVSDLVAPTA
jgi:hypothetical protein